MADNANTTSTETPVPEPSQTSPPGFPESKFGLGSDHSEVVVLVIKYFRIVGLVFFVWLFGYFGFSLAWVLLAAFFHLWRERTHSARDIKSEMIRAVQLDEKNAILARIDEVPSWVYFPDRERAEWVNKIIKQIWPYFTSYMNVVFTQTIEPIIQSSMPAALGKVRFERIDFGNIPPRIGSIKVYSEKALRGEIMMDLEVLYAGDAKIKLEIKKIVSGVKSIQFQGDLRVVLKPLCNTIPLFAAMTAYFLRAPSIDFDLTEAGNALDIPLISDGLRTTILDIFNKFLVLPNRLVIPIVPDYHLLDTATLQKPHPKGVLRLHIIRAFNLKAADIGFMQSGKSDPYVKISGVGNREYQTKVIDNNLYPEWNETFDIPVEDLDGNSTLTLNVYDKDLQNDDYLGGITMDVQQIIEKGVEEGTYTLKNVKRGQIQVRVEWFYLSHNPEQLKKIQEQTDKLRNLPVGLLVLNLREAHGLPDVLKKSGGITQPNSCAVLTIGDQRFSSITTTNTNNPQWNENFIFLLENPEHQSLNLTIEEKKTKKDSCSLDFKLSEILKEETLTLTREFDLKCKDSNSDPKIYLSFTLRIYSREVCEYELPTNYSASTSKTSSKAATPEKDLDKSPVTNQVGSAGTLTRHESTTKLQENENLLRQRSVQVVQPDIDSVADLGFGRVKIIMDYRLHDHAFVVTVCCCRNLMSVHPTNLPDPYVRLFLLPNLKAKHRTKSIKDTINPNYDDTFEWKIGFNDLKKCKLAISVKNEKSMLSRELVYMGEVLVDLEHIIVNKPRTAWYALREKSEAYIITEKF